MASAVTKLVASTPVTLDAEANMIDNVDHAITSSLVAKHETSPMDGVLLDNKVTLVPSCSCSSPFHLQVKLLAYVLNQSTWKSKQERWLLFLRWWHKRLVVKCAPLSFLVLYKELHSSTADSMQRMRLSDKWMQAFMSSTPLELHWQDPPEVTSDDI